MVSMNTTANEPTPERVTLSFDECAERFVRAQRFMQARSGDTPHESTLDGRGRCKQCGCSRKWGNHTDYWTR
jgi:hypothetical protein